MGSRLVSIFVGAALGGVCSTAIPAQSIAAGGIADVVVGGANVTLSVTAAPIESVLRQIARQARLTPVYSDRVAQLTSRLSLQMRNVPVTEAFEKALSGTGLRAVIVADKVAFVGVRGTSPEAQGSIVGKVTDGKTQIPLHGVTIVLDGASKGVTTGTDGTFRLSTVAPGSHTVTTRLLGYVKATKTVTVVDGQAVSVDLVLEPSVSALDQVVVTGTIVATAQRAIPNPITVITAQEIEARGITRVNDLLRGQVPNVIATDVGSFVLPSGGGGIYVRGSTSLMGANANSIKVYVDGIELSDAAAINSINPKSIERIEILRGPQASTIYGSAAISGVMQIFTKKGGAQARPQTEVLMNMGFLNTNLGGAFTPHHDHAIRVSGSSGAFSYNGGGTYEYTGAWVPAYYARNTGMHLGLRYAARPLTIDGTFRYDLRKGSEATQPLELSHVATGETAYDPTFIVPVPSNDSYTGQTIGGTVQYTPFAAWAHTLTMGRDQGETDFLTPSPRYLTSDDTLQSIATSGQTRTSFTYNTTYAATIGFLSPVLTVGADRWTLGGTSMSSYDTPALTGTLPDASVSRTADRNTGYFTQLRVGVGDRLFLTGGVRGEKNPNFGADIGTAIAPRVGVAYSQPVGDVEIKGRMAFGKAINPPPAGDKEGRRLNATTVQLANPNLGPEVQRGGDGGLEVYFGQRMSVNVTYYNQMVNGMLAGVSHRVSPTTTNIERQYQNVGQVRNRGWETELSLNLGPLVFKNTYSTIDSRILQLYNGYTGFAKVGDRMNGIAEHSGGASVTYSRSRTAIDLNVSYVGRSPNYDNARYDDLYYNRFRVGVATYQAFLSSYPGSYRTNVRIAHDVTTTLNLFVRVDNLLNATTSDFDNRTPTIGRESVLGFRMTL